MNDLDQIAEEEADAHRVEKDAAGASEDNCRKCGRPLGWFEPGLCDNCRAAHASEGEIELLDWAWTILANASGGDWTKESADWQQAVVKWRDEYHKSLSARRKVDPQCNLPRAAHASEAKPLERCSSNPHYEAHFGDESARATEK